MSVSLLKLKHEPWTQILIVSQLALCPTVFCLFVMSQSRSDVWGHFVAENQTSVKCKHCDAIIRRHGNTTNLQEHFIRRHSNVYQPTASTSAGSSSKRAFFKRRLTHQETKQKRSLRILPMSVLKICVHLALLKMLDSMLSLSMHGQPIKFQNEKQSVNWSCFDTLRA